MKGYNAMKKLIALFALVGIAAATFAALDVKATRCIPVFAPQSVSSGATNSVIFTVSSLRGEDAVVVVANAAAGRTLDVTLYATNQLDGGWMVYASGTFANTNSCVVRVPFAGQYLPRDVKLSVGSLGAASTAAAFIEAY